MVPIHPFMAFGTRVLGAGKLVLLGVALLATYILFAAASMRLALRSREVQVPDVVNRTATEASDTMAVAGLSLKLDDTRRVDPKISAGRVVAQDPAAGATLRQPAQRAGVAERRSASLGGPIGDRPDGTVGRAAAAAGRVDGGGGL